MTEAQGKAKDKAKAKAAKKAEGQQDKAKARNRRILWTGLLSVFLVFCLQWFGAFDLLEYKSVDMRFNWRGPRPMQVQGAVVAIDDESLNGWLDAKGVPSYLPERWPFPRDFYATVLKNLKADGARFVVFDIVFSESSKREPKQDQIFAAAAKEVGNVIFGERLDIQRDGAMKQETLIPPLDAAKLDKGFVNVPEASDGFTRVVQPLLQNSKAQPDPEMPGMDLVALRHLLGIKAAPTYDSETNSVHLGERVIPLFHRSVDINYAGPAGTVPTIPFHDVYNRTFAPGTFKDRVVYIGASTDILHDNKFTPFSDTHAGIEDFPGAEMHVHFLDTILTQQYLRHLSPWPENLLVILVGLVVVLLTYRITAFRGLVVAVLIAVAWVTFCALAFEAHNWVLPMVGPLTAVVLPFSVLAIYRGRLVETDARTYRQTFSKYVSKQIVDEILKNPEAMGGLGGTVKETTILFSDVRGFTAMSEKLSAPEVVEVLNEYLTAMVDIVIQNDGTVDKYVGDAIMAVWGSPLPDPKHRQKALRTAVQMMEVLQTLQKKWKAEGKPHIDIGIGLNTGHVVAGNMGHPNFKMDYTVIGDEVNLAARMESANKEMRSHVLITGSSFEGCEDMVDVILHPPIKVKGKEKPVDMIEVIGWKGQGRADWAEPLPLH